MRYLPLPSHQNIPDRGQPTRRALINTRRPRRGIALAIALMSLVIISAMVAGAAFFSTQNQRVADNSKRTQRSFAVAEQGIAEVMRSWKPGVYNMRQIYPLDSVRLDSTTASASGVYRGNMYRLNNQLYMAEISATDSQSYAGRLASSGARSRLGMLMRVTPLQMTIPGALTIGGPVTFGGGNVFINGNDQLPKGAGAVNWPNCPPLGVNKPGVVAKNPGDVASSQGQVVGNPNVLVDPSMSNNTFAQFGATDYATLAAQATITLAAPSTISPAPTTVGALCQYGTQTNWGDGQNPTAACGTYYPIVHALGNLTVNNGQGQGILLVDGNLVASGTWTYYGIVIVRGGFSTVAGGSPKVYGAVLAQSLNLATTAFAGDAVVDYSSCAVQRTMDATGTGTQLRSRGWFRML
jgi:hypothetical protein